MRSFETQVSQSVTAVKKIAVTGEKLNTIGDNIFNAGTKLLLVTVAVTEMGTASLTIVANFDLTLPSKLKELINEKESAKDVCIVY